MEELTLIITRPCQQQGFGFSVVWVRPPRIERLEHNQPACQAGLCIGDVILGVNGERLEENALIYERIRTTGVRLELLIGRRPAGESLGKEPVKYQPITTLDMKNQPIKLQETKSQPMKTQEIKSQPMKTQETKSQPIPALPGLKKEEPTKIQPITNQEPKIQPIKQQEPKIQPITSNPAKINQPITSLPPILKSTPSQKSNKVAPLSPLHPPKPAWRIQFKSQLLAKETNEGLKKFFIQQLKFFRAVVAGLDRYLIPAGSQGLMSQAEMGGVFGEVIKIITVTRRLLQCITDGASLTGWSLGPILLSTHRDHLPELTSAYSNYGCRLPASAALLAKKLQNQAFAKFMLETPLPRGGLDLTSLLFSPLLQLMGLCTCLEEVDLREVDGGWGYVKGGLKTCHSNLVKTLKIMEPCKSTLNLNTLSSLIISQTPLHLTQPPTRKWLFGSQLYIKESSGYSPIYAFLFTDLLVITNLPTKDKLYFVKEVVHLADLGSLHFGLKKKEEFKLVYGNSSSGWLGRLKKVKSVSLKAGNEELKCIWKLLLQRQIINLNTQRSICPSSSSSFSLSEFVEKFPEDVEIPEEVPKNAWGGEKPNPMGCSPPVFQTPIFKEQSPSSSIKSSIGKKKSLIHTLMENLMHKGGSPGVGRRVGGPTPENSPQLNQSQKTKETPESKPPIKPEKKEIHHQKEIGQKIGHTEISRAVTPPPPPPTEKVQHHEKSSPELKTEHHSKSPPEILEDTPLQEVHPPVHPPVKKPHRDSPLISGNGHRRILFDYRLRRDYPELFGIHPTGDRAAFIKSLGGEASDVCLKHYSRVSETRIEEEISVQPQQVSSSEIQQQTSRQASLNTPNFFHLRSTKFREGLHRSHYQSPPNQHQGNQESPEEEASSNDSGISDEANTQKVQQNKQEIRQATNYANFVEGGWWSGGDSVRPSQCKTAQGRSPMAGLVVKLDKATTTEPSSSSQTKFQERTATQKIQSNQTPPLRVKILQAPKLETPTRRADPRVRSLTLPLKIVSSLEQIESTEEEDTSSDAASASPALENGTTEPSWSSASDNDGVVGEGKCDLSANYSTSKYYQLVGSPTPSIDSDSDSPPTMRRYGTLEDLNEELPKMHRSKARFDFDKDDEEVEVNEDYEEEEDFMDDFDYGEIGASSQVLDNTYSVSRLGPLPPLLEEEYEEDYEEEYEADDEVAAGNDGQRSNRRLHPQQTYYQRIAKLVAGRSALSPLKIIRELWMRKRARERRTAASTITKN